jgi:hypothetical protein
MLGRGHWLRPKAERASQQTKIPGFLIVEKAGILSGFLNLTGANARRANANPAARAVDQRSNRLQIQIPPAIRNVVSVADPVSELRPAAAYFANSCHKTEIS